MINYLKMLTIFIMVVKMRFDEIKKKLENAEKKKKRIILLAKSSRLVTIPKEWYEEIFNLNEREIILIKAEDFIILVHKNEYNIELESKCKEKNKLKKEISIMKIQAQINPNVFKPLPLIEENSDYDLKWNEDKNEDKED